ncbi:hypothetical protein KEM54_004658, partial [Ascosphaera aggregata]
ALRDFLSENDITNYFAVLMDTNSSINNFSPSALEDPSMKSLPLPENSGRDLYPPIYTLDTWDVFSGKYYTGLDLEQSSESLRQFFSLGRPLWGALLEAGSSIEQVLALAKAKLDNLSGKLPLLSHCASFHIVDQAMNHRYVEKHLRYLVDVNNERTFIATVQPSEPILSHAALSSLTRSANAKLRALKELHEAMSRSCVDVGLAG